jgi:hypothetical protein
VDAMTNKYMADDDDLPAIFLETNATATCGVNPVATAKARIHREAQTLGIEISPDELVKFAVLFVAMEQD